MDCPRDDDYALCSWIYWIGRRPKGCWTLWVTFLAEYLRSSGRKLYVLGLSGGLDSSFSGPAVLPPCSYLGFVLPVASDAPEEMTRALRVCQAPILPLQSVFCPARPYPSLYRYFHRIFSNFSSYFRLAEGNIKASDQDAFSLPYGSCVFRLRAGHGSPDELLTGFWTLHGDVGDAAPFSSSPKPRSMNWPACSANVWKIPVRCRPPLRPCPRTGWASTLRIWNSWRWNPMPGWRSFSGVFQAVSQRAAARA